MRRVALAIFLLAVAWSFPARGATWYVDGSVPESGDGKTWATPFQRIQEGIVAASDGDTVTVAEGLYWGVGFEGKNVWLVSVDPADPAVVARTLMDVDGHGAAVRFKGSEDERCVLSGFTIRGGAGAANYAGGGIQGRGTRATIRNNVIANNSHWMAGGGIAECHGLIENNVITDNDAGNGLSQIGLGGGLYECDGLIRNNIIAGNFAWSAFDYPNLQWVPGRGGALYGCDGTIQNNTIARNVAYQDGGALYDCKGVIRNCIIWGNGGVQLQDFLAQPRYSCIQDWAGGGEGNISEDPRFVDAENGDFRLTADSPCIDAGFNDAELPETDIAGMHRIMFGGKSFTVDIGAYEFFYTGLRKGPGQDEATLVWSFVPDKTYSIFYTDDLFTWHTAVDNFPSLGSTTTSWLDDGSLTGLPPFLVPRRFYRLLENP